MSYQNSLYNFTINVCLLGDSSIGKSSLCSRLDKDKFYFDLTTTIGVDFLSKIYPVETKLGIINIKWNIYDTAGQEQYNSIVSSYYRNATIFLLGFDLTNLTSFRNLEKWIKQINHFNNNYYRIYLFGNKLDLTKKIQISDAYVIDFKEMYNIEYFQISVKKNINVTKMINYINDDIVKYLLDNKISDDEKIKKNIKINNYPQSKINLKPINYDSKCC